MPPFALNHPPENFTAADRSAAEPYSTSDFSDSRRPAAMTPLFSTYAESAKALLRKSLPPFVLKILGSKSAISTLSYAQEGEDKILAALLGFPRRGYSGFYVDVGAHHPERYSNTMLFYRKGWSGINIDAMPGSMTPFRRKRPRDINLEEAIAAENQTLVFYEFNEPTLNGFSKELSAQRDSHNGWKILAERKIQTTRLDDLLTRHIRDGHRIDFLSVDVEGLDFEVLKSNDWSKFRPSVVLVEDSETLWLGGVGNSKIAEYMRGHGYRCCCKTPLTTFFIDEKEFAVTPLGIRLRESAKN
jgi:FkbM family methyltransferase